MAVNNSTILARAWLNGSNDFQQRVPEPTQHSLAEVANAIFAPENRDLYNQFAEFMINRIGYSFAKQNSWKNRLREFKKQKLWYGSTVTETAFKWVKAHSYDTDAADQFKTRYPDGLQAFYSQDRQDNYPISIARDAMRAAVIDENGLNQIIAAQMALPLNACEWDTYKLMMQLFARADEKFGIYNHHLDAAPTTKEACEDFLTAAQTYAEALQFPTTTYSFTDIPVFVKPEELVLFVTPDVKANLNVRTLSYMFNVEKGDLPYRVVVVDEFPMPDTYAILTTSDFFQVYDTEYETTSQWDPAALKTNFWLHVWEVLCWSPFVPCIKFTTGAQTQNPVITVTPTGVSVTAERNNIAPGDVLQLTTKLAGTVAPADAEGIEVKPNACTYTVKLKDGTLNSRTRVDRMGRLHLQKTGVESGDVVSVSVVSTYQNPSGETHVYTASLDINVAEEG